MKENPQRPGVFVTTDGRVFLEIKAEPSFGGYRAMHLPGTNGRGTRGITVRRHTLVAETYVGPPPFDGAHVRHLDGNPANDKPSNLRWGSAKQNGQDTVRHGRSTRGSKNARAKLTDDQAREIKRRLRKGESGSELAREFNLKQATISNINTGTTWGWLK